ncbi:MAG: hypothetical protein F6J93_13175 [Oscillatoria sp. SIO1A7]|nr:hypothetical protein [Oscillatoria sp. SIO1A7]
MNPQNLNLPLSHLETDPEYNSQFHRSLSRQELVVLGWLASHPKGRTYHDLMRECNMTVEESHTIIFDLIQVGVLRRR